MATNIAPMSNEAVSVGRIMNRSFAAIGANPLVMLSIAFLFGALPSVIIAYFNQRLQISLVGQPNGVRDSAILTMGSAIIGLVLSMIVQGALVRATMAHSEGRRASFGESVVAGLRVVLPLIGLSLIVGFSIGFGLLLLIVPGVILYLIWSVAAPVLVEERSGVFGALGRSRSLTKGARWKIFRARADHPAILLAYFGAARLRNRHHQRRIAGNGANDPDRLADHLADRQRRDRDVDQHLLEHRTDLALCRVARLEGRPTGAAT
ncbi:MAG: hypothetical protein V4564_01785 [Pseudomonadota bacterium]